MGCHLSENSDRLHFAPAFYPVYKQEVSISNCSHSDRQRPIHIQCHTLLTSLPAFKESKKASSFSISSLSMKIRVFTRFLVVTVSPSALASYGRHIRGIEVKRKKGGMPVANTYLYTSCVQGTNQLIVYYALQI